MSSAALVFTSDSSTGPNLDYNAPLTVYAAPANRSTNSPLWVTNTTSIPTFIIASTTQAIPEPGSLTLALLGSACLAVVLWTRRRSRDASSPQAIPPAHS
jgi:hypothetical protein